ncbi:MAG: GTPase ObgE [Armatimonadota bacterium]|nr:GTPase ObgE [Armatimonadota bacterium]
MFVDEVKIALRAGSGGNGLSTFRQEKYAPRGGPDGGDGGHGGSIYLIADPAVTTLLDFRYKHHHRAQSGGNGQRSDKHGKKGEDLLLLVPVGTIVKDAADAGILGDLVEEGQRLLVAQGGRGGRGNARFCSPTNRAPRFAENGEPGEERDIELELKIMADVGLVGLPNAGKSSLLNRISAARPKIADYPFTTLTPVLGVVSLGDHRSCVIADIPGLIEGAHEGLGLGHQFLRHIERTRTLVHVLDATGGDSENPLENLKIVSDELSLHNPELAKLPLLVALNKIDIIPPDDILALKQSLAGMGLEALPISAATGEGVEQLLQRVGQLLPQPVRNTNIIALGAANGHSGNASTERVLIEPAARARPSRKWSVQREGDGSWRVVGEGLERLVAMTNVDNESALERLDRVLERNGIMAALRSSGVENGDTVRIRLTEFVFVEREKAFEGRRRRKE